MTNPYGPWATAIDTGGGAKLSSFWRKRLTMLVPTSQTSPVLSRRSLLGLVAAAALLCALPTFHVAPAVAEPNRSPHVNDQSGETSTAKSADEVSPASDQPATKEGAKTDSKPASIHLSTDGKVTNGRKNPPSLSTPLAKPPLKPAYSMRCRLVDAKGSVLLAPTLALDEGKEGIVSDGGRVGSGRR